MSKEPARQVDKPGGTMSDQETSAYEPSDSVKQITGVLGSAWTGEMDVVTWIKSQRD